MDRQIRLLQDGLRARESELARLREDAGNLRRELASAHATNAGLRTQHNVQIQQLQDQLRQAMKGEIPAIAA